MIGVDRYNAGWPVLRNAVKDAKLVAESLEKRGFNLTSKLNTDSATLEKTLKEFFVLKGQKPETRLFVWFAGHGHTENGEGYLAPVDAPPLEKSVSLCRFGDFLRLAESKHGFAVFASCFAGTVFDSARAPTAGGDYARNDTSSSRVPDVRRCGPNCVRRWLIPVTLITCAVRLRERQSKRVSEGAPRPWKITEPIPFVRLPVGTELNY